MMSEKIIVPTPTTKKVKDYALNTTKILYISLVLILLYMPIVFIIILSFNKNLLGTSFEGFTFQWYQKMLEKKNYSPRTLFAEYYYPPILSYNCRK